MDKREQQRQRVLARLESRRQETGESLPVEAEFTDDGSTEFNFEDDGDQD